MYVKLFSITDVGETIERFGYECKIVKAKYLFSIRQENIIGIDESEPKAKSESCYNFGYVDIENKCKLLDSNTAQEIANSRIVKGYYEIFLNEEARKLFPDVQRFYTDNDGYYSLLS